MKPARAAALLALGLVCLSSPAHAAPTAQIAATLDCHINVRWIETFGQWVTYKPSHPIPPHAFVVIDYTIENLGPAEASTVTSHRGLDWYPRPPSQWPGVDFDTHLVVGEQWTKTVVLVDTQTGDPGTYVATLDVDLDDKYFGTLAGTPAPSESCSLAFEIAE